MTRQTTATVLWFRILLFGVGTSITVTYLMLMYCAGIQERAVRKGKQLQREEELNTACNDTTTQLEKTIQKLEEQLRIEKSRAADAHQQEIIPIRTCAEKTNFVFIKMHKSGSETMTSLFHRYGDERNLEFVLPRGDEWDLYLGWPNPIREKDFRQSKSGTFNIMCEHSVFNKPAMSKVMPPDTVYITILREPFEQFKSSFRYHLVAKIVGIPQDSDILQEFFQTPETYDDIYTSDAEEVRKVRTGIPDGVSVIRNFMAHDLGYPKAQWKNSTYLKEFIGYIDNEFILVLILEYLEESLVLLKRLMCWEFQDIIYHPLNVAGYSYKTDRREHLVTKHKIFSSVDHALYEHFNRSLWDDIGREGTDFTAELEEYRNIQKAATKYCESNEKAPLTFPSSRWSKEVRLTRQFCKRYKLGTGGYLNKVLKRRYDGKAV